MTKKLTKEDKQMLVEKEAFRLAEFLNKLEKLYAEYELILNFDEFEIEKEETVCAVRPGRPQTFQLPGEVIKRLFKMINERLLEEVKETVDEIKK